jgi:hypothetical protein
VLWSYETTESFAKTEFCTVLWIDGDHSKCNFVPQFSWGGASGFTTYITKKHLKRQDVWAAGM